MQFSKQKTFYFTCVFFKSGSASVWLANITQSLFRKQLFYIQDIVLLRIITNLTISLLKTWNYLSKSYHMYIGLIICILSHNIKENHKRMWKNGIASFPVIPVGVWAILLKGTCASLTFNNFLGQLRLLN